MDMQVLKIHCVKKSLLMTKQILKFSSKYYFSRTCKRVDQEALTEDEMVEIEEDLEKRRELLERKCQELEQSLPKPKKEVSHLRYPKISY